MPFPLDDYTPHGYLDSPAHTRNLTPRGVVRSWDAGFRWYYPAHAGMYGGRRETYCAGFRIGIDGALDLSHFDRAWSFYHSKNIIAFGLARGGATSVEAHYQLIGEHALYGLLIDAHPAARITIHAKYARLLSANGEWGESGLVGRVEDGLLILQSFEDGDVFVVWTSQPWLDIGVTVDTAEVTDWAADGAPGMPETGFVPVTGRYGETVSLHAVIGLAPTSWLEIIMARGRTLTEARRHLDQARHIADAEYKQKLTEDEAFWARAPRLDGDWPAHWRRGLVYDLETLRMMVKQPIGIYSHVWDAMQIQAPRVVLAEAAIDALLLAYADPRLAQEVLLGTLLDAPLPNVPCSREDGSYNMVAADGTVCGTAPSWGFPFLVLEWLFALRPDRAWLERIYSRLAEHLDWWLTQRRAPDGWLFYACSWESGQDDSPRFGDQPLGGGHPVRHIRPVDLHAAVANAATVLARCAAALGHAADHTKWTAAAEEFAARTDQLWDGSRYADYDAGTGRFTQVNDISLLTPVALRLAQIGSSAQAVKSIDPDTLTWPMNAWVAVEAALAADMPEKAAELAATVCERAYTFWDARQIQLGRTLPGIACEYWPLDGRCGGEGYGWGAFTAHLLLHVLVGLTPVPDGLSIRPNLPRSWRAAGQRYTVHLFWGEHPLAVTIEPLDAEWTTVIVNERHVKIKWGEAITIPAVDYSGEQKD